jgi:hypothetical protein
VRGRKASLSVEMAGCDSGRRKGEKMSMGVKSGERLPVGD